MDGKFLSEIQSKLKNRNLNGEINYASICITDYYYQSNIKEWRFSIEGELFNHDIDHHDAISASSARAHGQIEGDTFIFFYGYTAESVSINDLNSILTKFDYCDFDECLNQDKLNSECQLMNEIESYDVGAKHRIECMVQRFNILTNGYRFPIRFDSQSSLEVEVYFAYNGVFTREGNGIRFFDDGDESKFKETKFDDSENGEHIDSVLSEMSEHYMGKEPTSFSVYNVGQGNLNTLQFDDESELMFDIGFTCKESHKKYDFQAAIQCIKNARCDVIVSHTDMDHIMGVIYAKQSLFAENYWIISAHKNMTMSAKRLVWYLQTNNFDKTAIIYGKNKKLINSSFNLYKGTGLLSKMKKYSTDINAAGIILSAVHEKSVIFAGDCLYPYWYSSKKEKLIKQHFDYIIVPHHGCSVKSAALNKYLNNQNARKCNQKAIVSVGVNSYGHPDKNHLLALSTKYKVEWTINHFKPIIEKL